MRGLQLGALGALWLQVITLGHPLPHVEQYEVVRPQRLPEPRARRTLLSRVGLYPERVSYVLGAGGHTFTLHLRKNRDLLGLGYVETYTTANGSEVTEQLHGQDHCFYQGHVEGHQGSAASLSTCAGLRGFFRVDSAIHLIEPLDGGGEEGQHAVYQAQHLRQKRVTCGVSNTSLDHALGPRIAAAFRPQPRNQPLSRDTRYVELYVVTDSAEFQMLGSRAAVRSRVLEVVNHVDKLYQELNFRVVLVGLEIWNNWDKFQVSPQADVTLDNFLAWRAQALTGQPRHDNVQLITGVDFTGTTVGLAKVSSMCSSSSGAVNQDHSQNPVGVASTLAHEMGHNLGMDHDENIQGCYCPVPREGGGCIMATSIGSRFPRMFSQCSQTDLETFLEKPQTGCLANAPDPDQLVGGPVCGNHFVERGEQCDCGPPQDCHNRCCNATTCQLAMGAECAHGDCCHECRVKPAGKLCRARKDSCDLEEFCDGQQPACPEDAFQENGMPCPGGYCFNGGCPTLAQRCQELWGPGARPAAETCFSYNMLPGCRGQSSLGTGRVNRCGVLYCEGGQKPPERSSCILTSHSAVCQALGMGADATYELVPEGTKCGKEKVCWEGRCQDFQVYRSRNCSAKCHSHGVCNHKRECHCQAGWAPPDCAELLDNVCAASGSFPVGVLVAVLFLVAVLVIVVAFIIYRKVRSHGQKRNAAPKTTVGLSNPLFRGGGSPAPAKARAMAPTQGSPELVSANSPSQPPRPTASSMTPKRLPPAPSAATSSPAFPVPVYTQQAPGQQLRPAPPTKPLPELKPKQVVKPTCAPPMPPVKPAVGKAQPGLAQGVVGPKVALKPPIQRR
ncbi:PREDICTED: disintegrin and metalloproteinase domain-containing protein 8 [Galeopterus variegatus]|uniref:Disintegrin and metalloproteinase domain-containing protein 8 n=1 Tax=Galeopterus variegatus TaxID=482537 RepID=A0ABM0S7A0_GALVR|nr:PREDICTED: disintegrin and metalloproteinase domain-containing protein 8 [Galeopterus variegatus]